MLNKQLNTLNSYISNRVWRSAFCLDNNNDKFNCFLCNPANLNVKRFILDVTIKNISFLYFNSSEFKRNLRVCIIIYKYLYTHDTSTTYKVNNIFQYEEKVGLYEDKWRHKIRGKPQCAFLMRAITYNITLMHTMSVKSGAMTCRRRNFSGRVYWIPLLLRLSLRWLRNLLVNRRQSEAVSLVRILEILAKAETNTHKNYRKKKLVPYLKIVKFII